MQATTVVCAALLLLVGLCTADETVEADEPVEEPGSGLGAVEAADSLGAELVKESRLGAKASLRSRFPAAMIGYNRYYPSYNPDYYYPVDPRSYYPSYPNYYPPANYPTVNYPPVNYPTGYPPNYPYEYPPYAPGVNEYSARHERA